MSGDDQLVSNLGVELLDQENVVEPSDFKRFTQQFGLSPDSEQVLTYLYIQALFTALPRGLTWSGSTELYPL